MWGMVMDKIMYMRLMMREIMMQTMNINIKYG